MKIVVLDGHSLNPCDLSWAPIESLGSCSVFERVPPEDSAIIEAIGDAEAVLVNKVPISRRVLDACPSVRYIGVLATGYNAIDVAAAKEKGIPVCNVPNYSTAAVSQHTIALLLEICCHVGDHSQAVRSGRWEQCHDYCFWDHPLIELADKTMGIIGYGHIGQAVGRIAEGLGMRLLVNAAHPRPELEHEGCRYASLDEIYAQSDVISMHCPLFPETKEMINKDSIARMKDGVIFLNASRGGLMVEQDVADALNSGKIAAAGLDCLTEEPPVHGSPLISAKNCFMTPHIAWAPLETRRRLMNIVADNLAAFQKGQPVNVVNP